MGDHGVECPMKAMTAPGWMGAGGLFMIGEGRYAGSPYHQYTGIPNRHGRRDALVYARG